MHSHFATSIFEQLQEKNKVTDDEQQKKEQEKDPKTPREEHVEQSAVTSTEVKTHNTYELSYSSKIHISHFTTFLNHRERRQMGKRRPKKKSKMFFKRQTSTSKKTKRQNIHSPKKPQQRRQQRQRLKR